jgi:hypothetical protein
VALLADQVSTLERALIQLTVLLSYEEL